ncbi:unnamed protein product [Urochloa humidicola]
MGRGGREMKETDASASEGEASLAMGVLNVLKRNVAESSASSKTCEAEEVDEVLKLQEEALLLMKPTAAEEAAEAAQLGGPLKKRKIMKQRVPRELIDYLMMARTCEPVDDIPEESLAEHSQEFREWHATEKAIDDKVAQYEQALINQFLTKGYAETLAEVTDDEEDN